MPLPIQPQNYGKLEEEIINFSFRNSGEIKIPKAKREIAYTQAVDIIIESIDFNLYENGKANPSIQFYGYVTLVFQDCLALEIPLHFPRQRVFDFRNWEALRQWNERAVFWEHWQFHRWNEIKIATLQGALEVPDVVEFAAAFSSTKFIECPLREVFVKVQRNCQFKIEYSQYQPVPYTDPFDVYQRGDSDTDDGEKDGGLPEDGIQPKRNSPSDPFKDNNPLRPPSPESGFFVNPSKLTRVPDANSDQICQLWVFGFGTRDCATIGTIEYMVGMIGSNVAIPSLTVFDTITCAGAPAENLEGYTRYTLVGYSGFALDGWLEAPTLEKRNCEVV